MRGIKQLLANPVTVVTTEKDIDDGKCGSPGHCAFALAVYRALGTDEFNPLVSVSSLGARIKLCIYTTASPTTKPTRLYARCSKEVADFIGCFDIWGLSGGGEKPKPFTASLMFQTEKDFIEAYPHLKHLAV